MIDKETFEIFRWIVIIVLGFPGLLIIILNWIGLAYYFITSKSLGSAPSFVGGVFSAIAIALLPWKEIRCYWYIPFVADYTWTLFLWFLLFYSWRKGGLFDKDVFDKTIHDPSSDHGKKDKQ